MPSMVRRSLETGEDVKVAPPSPATATAEQDDVAQDPPKKKKSRSKKEAKKRSRRRAEEEEEEPEEEEEAGEDEVAKEEEAADDAEEGDEDDGPRRSAKRAKKSKKASSSHADDEDDDDEDDADDKENLRNGRYKKSKKSSSKKGSGKRHRHHDDEEEDHDGEDRDSEENEEEGGAAPPASPAASRHQHHSHHHHAASIQSPLRQNRHVNAPGRPAEAGIVTKIHVENFMCHRKLTVDLCRNVNFIHGQNGSGKSAILAAVQICLGAGAKRTHRARNLKELVRKESGSDCSGAKVRVTLLNRGEDGYQRDVYGDSITVERSISLRGGYNGYKLLDSEGREQSRSKRDLDAMLDQLNIQVENPVAVLDQEEAKKFLTGKAEDKYAFFTKATELERLDRSYANCKDNVVELEETKVKVAGSLKGAKEHVKKLHREYKEFEALDKLEEDATRLRVMLGWSAYQQFAAKVEDEEKAAHKYESIIAKRQADLEAAQAAANVTDDEESNLQTRLAELAEEASQAASQKASLESDQKKAKAPLKKKELELKTSVGEIKSAKKRLKSANRALQEARDQIKEAAGNAETEERRRTEATEKAEKQLTEIRATLDPLTEEINDSLRKYEEMEPHVAQAKNDCSLTNSSLQNVKRKIRDLQSSEGGNSLAVFGQKCAAMHKKVEDAKKKRKFKGPVLGPIGAYIKVAPGKEAMAKIAENAIGGGLDRFIVTDDADRALFMKLRKEVGCGVRDCGIYQSKPGARYNVPAPPEGVESVASVLSVADDLVWNTLIDNGQIDTKALAESKEASEAALLVQNANGKEAIRGGAIRQVFFLPNGDYWQVKGGNRSMISNEKKLKQSIGVDKSAAIEEAKQEIKVIEAELKENRKAEAEILKKAKVEKIRWNKASKDHRLATKKIEDLQNLIEEIKAEAEASTENVTIDTSEFEEDVKSAEEELEQLKEKEVETKKEIEALKPPIEEIRRQLEETKARNGKVLDDINKAEQQLEEFVKGHAQRQANVEKKREKLEQMQEALAKQNEVIAKETETRDKTLRKARVQAYTVQKELQLKRQRSQEVHGTPVEGTVKDDPSLHDEPTDEDLEAIEPEVTDKEPSYYKAKVDRLKKQIKTERERRQMSEKDPVVVFEKYQRAKRDLEAKVHQIETIEKNIEVLKTDIKERIARWRQFRRHICEQTNATFDEMLNKKGSSGEIEFDHEENKLDLIVQKDNMDECSQTKDVKALSGGERSFTTLSLLLALGENLETPFRVMDEFDVFLDPVSRKIALEQLVSTAKGLEHRQFIFITPQDLSSMKTDPMLRIFHMKAPKRGNVVGGPSQQTLNFESTPR